MLSRGGWVLRGAAALGVPPPFAAARGITRCGAAHMRAAVRRRPLPGAPKTAVVCCQRWVLCKRRSQISRNLNGNYYFGKWAVLS